MTGRRVANHLPEFTGPLIGLAELGNSGADAREWATKFFPTGNVSVVSTLEYAEEIVTGYQLESEKLYQPWTAMLFAMGAIKRVTELPRLGRVREKARAGDAVKAMVPTIISTALRLEVPNFEAVRFKPGTHPYGIQVAQRSEQDMAAFVNRHTADFKVLSPIISDYWKRELPNIAVGSRRMAELN